MGSRTKIGTTVSLVATLLAGCSGSIDGRPPGEPPPAGAAGQAPQTPGSPPSAGAPVEPPSACKSELGPSPLRRLTRLQYANTVRALLGEELSGELKVIDEFSADELAGSFPANYFTPISDSQFSQYATAAGAVAARAVQRLPQLLPCASSAGGDAGAQDRCARQFIEQFGRRAYRRPLSSTEVERYQRLFADGRKGGDLASGLELVVQAMLESPHTLYLVEGPGALTQHQLAARLSYFLWNAPPDAGLDQAADAGKLGTVADIRREAARMLADARALDMLQDFHTRWLALEDLAALEKDPAQYPEFAALRPAVQEETRRFISHVLSEGDGRLETLLTAPFTIATGPLARLYGASSDGDGWRKVELDPRQRAGLLTQAAFLATHGHEGSAPIFRGVAVREQLFCASLPPPPPGADQNLPPRAPTQTTRQRMEQHRQNPECASCHQLMDVLGYGFEAYDDIGRFRTTENGLPIDDSGEILGTDVDGPFRGALELGRRLAASKQVHSCLVGHWFRYAMGRLETELDRCTLDRVLSRFHADNLRVPDLLLALVESDAFRSYRAEEVSP